MTRNLDDLLTHEELAEIARLLSCTPQNHDEEVALSAVGKLLKSYEDVLDVAIDLAMPKAAGEPS